MSKSTRQFDRMKMVPKPLPAPKKTTPPKREVISRDIVRFSKPDKKIAKQLKRLPRALNIVSVNKGHATVWQPKVIQKSPYSWSALMYVTACLVLGMFSLHALSFLDVAKSASGRVLGDATSAYEELNSANESLGSQDFSGAKSKFTQAQDSLIQAQDSLDSVRLLALVAPPARSADNILTGAYFLAEAGKNLTTAMQLFDELSVTSDGISTENFTDKLNQNHALLKNSLLMLGFAEEKFNNVSGLPAEYDETLAAGKNQISTLKNILSDLVDLEDLFLSFFGTEPKTYLLVFQNYDEIRATGGFIGTYGVLKYENGKINDLKIESIYNIDGSLGKLIAAPGPFQPEIKKWALRDSNWFADFPTSAQKMLEFFEMESETASGVIAMTPKIFADILKMIGPVSMPQYDVTLTADNFQDIVQDQTSYKYDKELNQPKKFLDDFAPVLLNRLTNLGKEQWFQLFQIMRDNFNQRHVMVYSEDQETQNKIANLGFDGRILETDHDYLSVVNSNLGGTKTDLDIRQSIYFQSDISSEGEITNTVRVSRQNVSDEPNTSYMRILVPEGSKLISSSGFSDAQHNPSTTEGYAHDSDLAEWDKQEISGNVAIKSETGKTVFAGWVETSANETGEISIKYSLPFKIDRGFLAGLLNKTQAHSLLFQKQPGNLSTYFEGVWNINDLETVWTAPGVSVSGNQVKFNALAEADQYWGMVLKK